MGDQIVVYGEVTQFDSATGPDTFLASSWASLQRPSYGYVDYSDDTFYTGREKQLENVVAGDLIRAYVTVDGSFSYDTQIGGNTTVPVDRTSVYDHRKN